MSSPSQRLVTEQRVKVKEVGDCQNEIYKSYHENKEAKDEQTKKVIFYPIIWMSLIVYYILISSSSFRTTVEHTKLIGCSHSNKTQWLKPWVDFSTEKRQQATSDFEKTI